MAKMDDDTLVSIINAAINECAGTNGGVSDGRLSRERAMALDYYFGRPFGDEVDYRSSVIITEVADTVGWILPSLLKVFTTNEDIVRFDPVSREDDAACEEETEAVNNIFYKQNQGFLILYSFFWDALVQKTGYIKTYWEDDVKITKETYMGLDDMALNILMADPELTALEYEQTTQETTGPDGQLMQSQLYNLVVQRKCPYGKCKIEVVPPEEIYISPRTRSLDLNDTPFIAQISRKTKSDLLEMGIPKSKLEDLGSMGSFNYGEVAVARDLYDEEVGTGDSYNSMDDSMSEYYIADAYIKADVDGDGRAEWWKVLLAGNKILEKQEVDGNPFSAICPCIIPHRHYGQSVADLVMDLQRIESSVARNILDNFYIMNNQRTVVGPGVHLDDLMQNRPGGIVRTDGVPGQDVMPMPVSPIGDAGFSMLDWIESIREKRTGVSKNSQGLNENVVGDTAHGTERLMTAAEQKIDMIAKVFAETGLKDVFLKIHSLMRKHGYATEIKLKTGWKNIDPTEWVERNSMSIKVGLGAGEQSKTQNALAKIMEIQNAILTTSPPGVLVNMDNQYNAAIDFARTSGLPNPASYFNSPQSPDAQQILNTPPPPDPNVEFMKMQSQIESLKAEIKQKEIEYKAELESQKQQAEFDMKAAELEKKYAEIGIKHKEFLMEMELAYNKDVSKEV